MLALPCIKALAVWEVLNCRAWFFFHLNVGQKSHKIGGNRPDMTMAIYREVKQQQMIYFKKFWCFTLNHCQRSLASYIEVLLVKSEP